jgi:histidinol-phosphate aminotransferase
VRQPFNVNAVALAAACAALDDRAHIERAVALNHSGMAQVAAGLDRLGLRRYASAGNFLLFDCGRDAAKIYDAMLHQGVIVRPVASYQLPTHLRVTIGTAAQNERMLAALAHALNP